MFKSLNISDIPELHFLPFWLQQNPEKFEEIVTQYKKLIENLISISSDRIQRIQNARIWMEENSICWKNASNINTISFLENNLENNESIRNIYWGLFEWDLEVLMRLQWMLERWSKISLGTHNKPVDGDEIWDKVIWWHTQISQENTEAFIHFLIGHYLSQYMNRYLWEECWLSEKDDFLVVLTDVLIETHINTGELKEIFDIWLKWKNEWWLWWINPEQVNFYKKI